MATVEWMTKGPYGVMVHWIKATRPGPGQKDIADWNERVDAFDVNAFCDRVEATGAKWLIFPFGHVGGGGYFNSPNSVIDSKFPGHCSNRDLSLEIAREITRRGIKFLGYMFTEWDAAGNLSREFATAMDWEHDTRDKSLFMENFYALIAEWGKRLGPLLSGWWFDGCYDAKDKSFLLNHDWSNERFDPARMAAAARAGNPQALITMNPGANSYECVFPEIEDYLGGEANDLNWPLEPGLIKGLQRHVLVWIDCFWAHDKEDGEMAPPRYSDEELIAYLQKANETGVGITLNLGVYQDGTFGAKMAEQMNHVCEVFGSALPK